MRSRGSKPANLRTKKKTIKNVIVINGSPRTKWNTATLLEHALAGAASQGADTEHAHLYDLGYTGCTSYFACKLKGGKSYGKCAMKDGLTPALENNNLYLAVSKTDKNARHILDTFNRGLALLAKQGSLKRILSKHGL